MKRLLFLVVFIFISFAQGSQLIAASCLGGVDKYFVNIVISYHPSWRNVESIEVCFTDNFWHSSAGKSALSNLILGMSAGKITSREVDAELAEFRGGVRKNHSHTYKNVTVDKETLQDPIPGSTSGVTAR
ncbi:hypothetical protein IWQ51_006823 [Labrenzia sp. EL_142]|nr:hypothetical protein [Labrenzia sp. EL_142]